MHSPILSKNLNTAKFLPGRAQGSWEIQVHLARTDDATRSLRGTDKALLAVSWREVI